MGQNLSKFFFPKLQLYYTHKGDDMWSSGEGFHMRGGNPWKYGFLCALVNREASVAPVDREASVAPMDREASVAPVDMEASVASGSREARVAPVSREVSVAKAVI